MTEVGNQFRENEHGQLQFNDPSFRKYEQDLDSLSNEPHRMSPTQLLEHPDTLFHSSDKDRLFGLQTPKNESLAGSNRYYGGTAAKYVGQNYTHAGSELSALRRAETVGGVQTHLHTVHVPHKNYGDEILSDEDANADSFADEHLEHYGLDQSAPDPHNNTPHYYDNEVEDNTSLSSVIPRSHALTHHDYVRQAIDAGKGHEVHPETLRQYHQGTLNSKLETLSPSQVTSRAAQLHDPDLAITKAHGDGLFPYTLTSLPPTGGVERQAMSEEEGQNWVDDGTGSRLMRTSAALNYNFGRKRNAEFRAAISGISPRRVERGIGSEWA
jgi:hypothetical protein